MTTSAHKTEGVNRTKIVRSYPFVSLPERMRTACDRSGANGNGASSRGTRRTDNARGQLETNRFLFWTEDSRMHAAVDEKHFSYYVYDHSGERRLKLTGINKQQDVCQRLRTPQNKLNEVSNADLMATYTVLNEPTLYPSAYMVLTNKGYTKHYYAGTDLCASREQSQACLSYAETKQSVRSNRVAARLGGGGLDAQQHVIAIDEDLQWRADRLFKQSLEQVNYRVLGENKLECIMNNEFARDEFGKWIDGIPYQVRADVETEYWQFKEMVNSMLEDRNHGHEKNVYFYHGDHLGSASWITDYRGMAVQHIPSVSNSRGTYCKERYEFNPLKLKAKDSLLKDL